MLTVTRKARRLVGAGAGAVALAALPATAAAFPPIPQNVHALAAVSSEVPTIAWDPATGAINYRIRRSDGADCVAPAQVVGFVRQAPAPIVFTDEPPLSVIPATPNATYSYTVRAVAADGEVSP